MEVPLKGILQSPDLPEDQRATIASYRTHDPDITGLKDIGGGATVRLWRPGVIPRLSLSAIILVLCIEVGTKINFYGLTTYFRKGCEALLGEVVSCLRPASAPCVGGCYSGLLYFQSVPASSQFIAF